MAEPKERKRVSKPKRNPKKPTIQPVDSISPRSITRRLANLVQEGRVQEVDASSTSVCTSSAKRALEMSCEDGNTSNI